MLALAAELVKLACEFACVDKVGFIVAELLDDFLEEGLEFEEVTPALVLVLKVVGELDFGVLETPGEDEEAMFEAELALIEVELPLMLEAGAELEAELLLSVTEMLLGAEAALELAF